MLCNKNLHFISAGLLWWLKTNWKCVTFTMLYAICNIQNMKRLTQALDDVCYPGMNIVHYMGFHIAFIYPLSVTSFGLNHGSGAEHLDLDKESHNRIQFCIAWLQNEFNYTAMIGIYFSLFVDISCRSKGIKEDCWLLWLTKPTIVVGFLKFSSLFLQVSKILNWQPKGRKGCSRN